MSASCKCNLYRCLMSFYQNLVSIHFTFFSVINQEKSEVNITIQINFCASLSLIYCQNNFLFARKPLWPNCQHRKPPHSALISVYRFWEEWDTYRICRRNVITGTRVSRRSMKAHQRSRDLWSPQISSKSTASIEIALTQVR